MFISLHEGFHDPATSFSIVFFDSSQMNQIKFTMKSSVLFSVYSYLMYQKENKINTNKKIK